MPFRVTIVYVPAISGKINTGTTKQLCGRGGAATQKKVLSRKSVEMVAQGSLGFRGYLFRRICGYNAPVYGSTASKKKIQGGNIA